MFQPSSSSYTVYTLVLVLVLIPVLETTTTTTAMPAAKANLNTMGNATGTALVVTRGTSFTESPEEMERRTEQRLRDRWNQFLSERTKQLEFDDLFTSPTAVYAIRGRDLFVSCGLSRPLSGRHKISFLRLSDLSLISVGLKLHLNDPRVSVINARHSPRVWTLRVRRADARDSGQYECQLNTQPSPLRRVFDVTVLESHVHIVPSEKVTYVNVGSDLVLTCVVDTGPLVPSYITWYRDEQVVKYSKEIKASVFTNINPRAKEAAEAGAPFPEHRSELVIREVSASDSGDYRCTSDLTGEAKILVYVVEEDFKSLHSGGQGQLHGQGGLGGDGGGGGGSGATRSSPSSSSSSGAAKNALVLSRKNFSWTLIIVLLSQLLCFCASSSFLLGQRRLLFVSLL